MSCNVYARTAENRDPYKTAGNGKYSGSMLTEIAKELVQRSTTSSQVTKVNIGYYLTVQADPRSVDQHVI